jgi:hypothetical protein
VFFSYYNYNLENWFWNILNLYWYYYININLLFLILIFVVVIPDLITFIHGNSSGIKVAAINFFAEIVKNGKNIDDNNLISVTSVKRTIKAIATKASHMSPWYFWFFFFFYKVVNIIIF